MLPVKRKFPFTESTEFKQTSEVERTCSGQLVSNNSFLPCPHGDNNPPFDALPAAKRCCQHDMNNVQHESCTSAEETMETDQTPIRNQPLYISDCQYAVHRTNSQPDFQPSNANGEPSMNINNNDVNFKDRTKGFIGIKSQVCNRCQIGESGHFRHIFH